MSRCFNWDLADKLLCVDSDDGGEPAPLTLVTQRHVVVAPEVLLVTLERGASDRDRLGPVQIEVSPTLMLPVLADGSTNQVSRRAGPG